MDDWTYQDMTVAQFFGVSPAEVGDWYNADFLDSLEYVEIQHEVDRRAMQERRDD